MATREWRTWMAQPRPAPGPRVFPLPEVRRMSDLQYAELHCLTNFTFLRGASHPHELVTQAHAEGYEAIAITDECSMAGVVRALIAVKDLASEGKHIRLIVGAEFRLTCGLRFV